MTSTTAWALVAGLGLGFGLWSLVSLVPILDRPRLLHRVAPYLVDISAGARELLGRRTANPLPVVGSLLAPLLDRASKLLAVVLGGPEQVRLRLRQAGRTTTVEDFRSRQLVWGAVGLVLGAIAAVVLHEMQDTPPGVLVALVPAVGAGGVVLCDQSLQRAATERLSRMSSELPTILEFLTLSLSAGEGIFDGMRRISRISTGELAAEFGGIVSVVNTGIPFTTALTELADDMRLPPLSRAVEQIVGALERGTPLVDVLRAQAQDSRELAKRDLLEVAGKKEVAMLVPLVFLILPTTIVFAIYPGIFVLQVGF